MPKIMRSINAISRCQVLYRAEHLDGELLATHHSFALWICKKPGRSQEELSRALCLNKSTVTRALFQLEERGFVRREENPEDKRELLVYPTEKLLDILPRVSEIAREWTASITEEIPEEELLIFEDVLHRIAARARVLANKNE